MVLSLSNLTNSGKSMSIRSYPTVHYASPGILFGSPSYSTEKAVYTLFHVLPYKLNIPDSRPHYCPEHHNSATRGTGIRPQISKRHPRIPLPTLSVTIHEYEKEYIRGESDSISAEGHVDNTCDIQVGLERTAADGSVERPPQYGLGHLPSPRIA